jgi:spore cortex formation protein SpoVR/YcgB (stage V sporulation)
MCKPLNTQSPMAEPWFQYLRTLKQTAGKCRRGLDSKPVRPFLDACLAVTEQRRHALMVEQRCASARLPAMTATEPTSALGQGWRL